jgi:hypothetical protein
MRKTLIVTDVTRMRSPRVCVGCVDEQGKNIRPVLEWGNIEESWLSENGKAVIRPFAKVAFELIRPKPQSPHTEDWIFNPEVKEYQGEITQARRLRLLEKISDRDVASIFGAEICHSPGFYIRENEGNRSMGTVRAAEVKFVHYEQFDGIWGYRINFIDESDESYRLRVTDLAFHCYLDEIRVKRDISGDQVGVIVAECLRGKVVYLRIGLSRPTWQKYPHCCFLQINGVYSFPDYLEGRCFADF